MKIYFAGSIRGGRKDVLIYNNIINYLLTKGEVLTEHIGNISMKSKGENIYTDKKIYKRDIDWLNQSDVVIAEVTSPSLGVGYELGISQSLGKPVLCLYRDIKHKKLSAMIAGNKYFNNYHYKNIDDAKKMIQIFLNKFNN